MRIPSIVNGILALAVCGLLASCVKKPSEILDPREVLHRSMIRMMTSDVVQLTASGTLSSTEGNSSDLIFSLTGSIAPLKNTWMFELETTMNRPDQTTHVRTTFIAPKNESFYTSPDPRFIKKLLEAIHVDDFQLLLMPGNVYVYRLHAQFLPRLLLTATQDTDTKEVENTLAASGTLVINAQDFRLLHEKISIRNVNSTDRVWNAEWQANFAENPRFPLRIPSRTGSTMSADTILDTIFEEAHFLRH